MIENPNKKLISVSDIAEYCFCPRKVYLRIVKGLREPPNPAMIQGKLRHEILDLFNKKEEFIAESIDQKISEKEIQGIYQEILRDIALEVIRKNHSLLDSFRINKEEFFTKIMYNSREEIAIRVEAVKESLEKGFVGKKLWENLSPKYITELSISSESLGLRGRIDRVLFDNEKILPFEIKTRMEVFEQDKLQLASYALLLEQEFKKKIEKGIIETLKERKEIELTEELKQEVLRIADIIRNMQEVPQMPSSFSKCNNCKIKEECLRL